MRPEHWLHRAAARYLKLALRSPTAWTTIGHGGGGKKRGGELKAMGLKPGWPDILVLHPLIVLGIELKAPKGAQSPDQKDVAAEFKLLGAHYAIGRRIEDVEVILRQYGIPVFASVIGLSFTKDIQCAA